MKRRLQAYIGVILIFLILGAGMVISYAIVLTTNRNTKPIENPLDGSLGKDNKLYLLNAPLKDVKELIIRRKGKEDLIFRPKSALYEDKRVWYLANPILEFPDEKKIWDFVSRILNLRLDKLIETFDNIDDLHLSDYGFDRPHIIVTVNTQNDSKSFMVGKRIIDDEILLDDLVEKRYVYSNQYKQLGILSHSIDVLSRNYTHFNKNIMLLNSNEEILSLNIYDNELQSGSLITQNKEGWQLQSFKSETVAEKIDSKKLDSSNEEVEDLAMLDDFIIAELFSEFYFADYLREKQENRDVDNLPKYELSFTLRDKNKEASSIYHKNIYLYYDIFQKKWLGRIQYHSFEFVVPSTLIDQINKLIN